MVASHPLPPPPRLVLGTCPMTQACALTGNRTGDLLVLRLVLDQLSHTSQGSCFCLGCFSPRVSEMQSSCHGSGRAEAGGWWTPPCLPLTLWLAIIPGNGLVASFWICTWLRLALSRLVLTVGTAGVQAPGHTIPESCAGPWLWADSCRLALSAWQDCAPVPLSPRRPRSP